MRVKPKIAVIVDCRDWAFDFFRRDLERHFPQYAFEAVIGGSEQTLPAGVYDAVLACGTWWPIEAYTKERCMVSCRSMRQFKRKGFLEYPGGPWAWFDRFYRIMTGNSREIVDLLRPYRPDVEYLPTAIDTDHFKPIQRDRRLGCGLLIGWAGNRQPLKQVDLIERAVARVPGCKFITAERGMNAVPWEDMPSWFNQLDVYVCASQERVIEGSNRSLLEAMACGIPVISSHSGEATELIVDGVNGYLFDGTEDDLVEKLTKMMDYYSQSDRASMGQAARASIVNGWSWDVLRPQYDRILADLLYGSTGEKPKPLIKQSRQTTTDKISIIVPVYNEIADIGDGVQNFAEETVKSILQGTDYPNYEIVCIEDGTDESCKNLDRLDRRVKVFHNTSTEHGCGIARNLGTTCSDGDWVLYIDAHMLFPRKLQRVDLTNGQVLFEANQDFLTDLHYIATQRENALKHIGASPHVIVQAITLGYHPHSTHMKHGCDWKFHPRYGLPDARWTSREIEYPFMETNVLLGACYLMRRETMQHLGGWLCGPGKGYNEAYLSTVALMCNVPLYTATTVYARHLYDSKIPKYRGVSYNNIVQRQRLATHILYDELRPLIQERAFGSNNTTTDREMCKYVGSDGLKQRYTVQNNRVLSDEQVLRAMDLWGEYSDVDRIANSCANPVLTIQDKIDLLTRIVSGRPISPLCAVWLEPGKGVMDYIGFPMDLIKPGNAHPPELNLFLGGLDILGTKLKEIVFSKMRGK